MLKERAEVDNCRIRTVLMIGGRAGFGYGPIFFGSIKKLIRKFVQISVITECNLTVSLRTSQNSENISSKSSENMTKRSKFLVHNQEILNKEIG